MAVIIFGATGFLGSHITEQLVLAGHSVTCVVRPGSDTRFIDNLAVRVVRQRLTVPQDSGAEGSPDIPGLGQVIAPGDSVCNCIADTRDYLSDAQRRATEVTLTTALYRAARKAGASHFIQLSTVMVYGFDRPASAIDENFPVQPRYSYSRIADEREQALLDDYSDQLPLTLLRPSNALGQRDASFLPGILAAHRWRVFPLIGRGRWRFSCIDARDIGRCVDHLLTKPAQGSEVFLVKGYDTDWLSFKTALDQATQRHSYRMHLPKTAMLALGRLLELTRYLGARPTLSRFSVSVISTNTLFDDSKIKASGFTAHYSLADSLADALPTPQPTSGQN